jgi:hypothetical protein
MEIEGAWFSLILIEIEADAVRFPESLTWAVTWCDPFESVAVIELPVPRLPLMLDVHLICDERFPSSESLADATKLTADPAVKELPFPG